MNTGNKRGPMTEPWGKPHASSTVSDLTHDYSMTPIHHSPHSPRYPLAKSIQERHVLMQAFIPVDFLRLYSARCHLRVGGHSYLIARQDSSSPNQF